jgi:hypothetical protein
MGVTILPNRSYHGVFDVSAKDAKGLLSPKMVASFLSSKEAKERASKGTGLIVVPVYVQVSILGPSKPAKPSRTRRSVVK